MSLPGVYTVQLRGSAEALLAMGSTEVSCSAATPRGLIASLATEHPVLWRELLTDDGVPRRSSKLLVNGAPVDRYDEPLPAGSTVTIVSTLPCDG